MTSVAIKDQTSKTIPSPAAHNVHVIADLTGYETPDTLKFDRACLDAYARLTAAPRGELATAEPSRLAKALDLARSGAVQIEPTYMWVHGATGEYSWERAGGRCTCPDRVRYKTHPCKHELAAVIALEAQTGHEEPPTLDLAPEVLPAPMGAPAASAAEPLLPEAAFSLSLKVSVLGREGQLTCRGGSIEQFTRHLQAVKSLLVELDQAPEKAPTPEKEPDQHSCSLHGAMKPSSKAPGQWYCAHKLHGGTWCKAKA